MAMMPKAPGLFSTRTFWPRICRICSPTMRMTMSVALPGPNGTTILIGLLGNLSCAAAGPAAARHRTAKRARPVRFMSGSLQGGGSVRQLDLHFAGDLAPRIELALEPGLRVVQRLVRLDTHELLGKGLLQLRNLGRFENGLMQRRQHVLRRLRRRKHGLPVQRADTGETGLGQ